MASKTFERLDLKPWPEAYLKALEVGAEACTSATEGMLMSVSVDTQLSVATKKKKIETAMAVGIEKDAAFFKSPIKKTLHPAVYSHAMSWALKS